MTAKFDEVKAASGQILVTEILQRDIVSSTGGTGSTGSTSEVNVNKTE